MAIRIREKTEPSKILAGKGSIVYEYFPVNSTIPAPPTGSIENLPKYSYVGARAIKVPEAPALEMPETGLPRALSYAADAGGCAHWRLLWPEFLINGYNKGIVNSLTQMILDVNFYRTLKSVKLQRQATDSQLEFIMALKGLKSQTGLRLLYEIDDIVFKDDIPEYNRCRDAFIDQKIVDNILKIMAEVDEITVTCQYMKEYYQNRTGNKNVTVIPNYIPKFWADRFYNSERIEKLFDENKKRPRILYAGSGTHIDVLNRTGGNDDFGHVLQQIVKTRKDFKYVFKGCFPIQLKPFIDSGEMEFVPWSPLFELPQGIYELGCQAVFAPLADNIFNKSKSNIKMQESGALGIPGAFQDLCTYADAEFKFKTGDELVDRIKEITKDSSKYMQYSCNARNYVEKNWLEDHLDEHLASYYTEYGSVERNSMSQRLIELNPEQKIS